ncbi:MAG: antibiotic biosynthesis monooxygenase, partial [Trebonia sp.]
TEIGADMSGRRRRDDEWGDGRLDAQDDRRDPWADGGVGDWGAERGDDGDRPGAASGGGYARGGGADGHGRNAVPGGQSYAAPSFQSRNGGDGYGTGSAQRGASNGYAPNGYAPNGYAQNGYGGDGRDVGHGAGRDGYQSAGYGGGNAGFGRPGYGPGGQGNGAGYGAGGGYTGANGHQGTPGFNPEYMAADNDDADDDATAGTPRPYGRLSIYTLHEDKTREFDRLAERAAEGVRASEPDTLVYVIHVVPKAPMQRIIYEIYRDRGALLSHERQPHIRQFAADRAPCVLATNIIDLRLKYAKVAALGSAAEATAAPQASWTPRGENAQGNDLYAATTQYSPAQSPAPQYSQAQGVGPGMAASFTPASDYGTDNSQVPTVGREAFSPSSAAQYGNSDNGAYGAGSGQYGAANSNGYASTATHANGGSYSSNGYQSPQEHPGSNGYPSNNSYSSANGYQGSNGYSGANGYSNGAGHPGSAGNGYASGGYADNGAGSYGASAAPQYTPRYRELTSGPQSDEASDGSRQGNGNRYDDGGRQSAKPSEWQSQSQDHR